jgi:hypothetical protein
MRRWVRVLLFSKNRAVREPKRRTSHAGLFIRRTLKERLDALETAPESLRAVRAVEVLEWIASPDATWLLSELAKGVPDARPSHEVTTTGDRLAR